MLLPGRDWRAGRQEYDNCTAPIVASIRDFGGRFPIQRRNRQLSRGAAEPPAIRGRGHVRNAFATFSPAAVARRSSRSPRTEQFRMAEAAFQAATFLLQRASSEAASPASVVSDLLDSFTVRFFVRPARDFDAPRPPHSFQHLGSYTLVSYLVAADDRAVLRVLANFRRCNSPPPGRARQRRARGGGGVRGAWKSPL